MTDAAPRMIRRTNGADTVTVACNLPNGIILQVHTFAEVENFYPNGRSQMELVATLDTAAGQYALNGAQLDYGALAGGGVPDYRVIKGASPGTGYALTNGIPRAFWERWLDENKNSDLIKGRNVYAEGTEASAADKAREYKDFKSGFQGLNPSGDYRVPSGRGIRKYNPNDNRVTPEQSEVPSE